MAKKATWHDRIIAYMVAFNYRPLPYRGDKYERFGVNVSGEKYRTYLVGKSGSVRCECTWIDSAGKTQKSSWSVTDVFKRYVEKWEGRNNV